MKLLLQMVMAVMPQKVRIVGIAKIDLQNGAVKSHQIGDIGGRLDAVHRLIVQVLCYLLACLAQAFFIGCSTCLKPAGIWNAELSALLE